MCELPSFFTSGTIEISATVNFDNTDPPEADLSDNIITTRVSFDEVVPNPDLTFYLLTYQLGSSTLTTDRWHADQGGRLATPRVSRCGRRLQARDRALGGRHVERP